MAEDAYLIGAGDRSLWLGLGPVRVGVLAAGVLAAVTAGYAGTPVPIAAIPLALAAVWSFAHINGTPVHEVTLSGSSLVSRLISGASGQPATLTAVSPTSSGRNRGPTALRLPSVCGRLTLASVDVDGLELGVLCERGRQGWEVVCLLKVVGDAGFSLLEVDEQSRRLAGWGDVLTAVAGEYADRCRLQWIETAAAEPVVATDATDRGLAADVGDQSLCHRTVLAARVRTGQRDRDAAIRRAEPLYRLLTSRLLAGELVAEPLSQDATHQQLRRSMTGTLAALSAVSTDPTDGPASRKERWAHLRTDDVWHRSYLVTGWPRIPVGPAWLSPLLNEGPSKGWRSITMHFEAVRPELAGRRARAARQSASLDLDDRARLGFGVGARERRTQQEADAADEELAAGHVQHRVAGLILVSANSLTDLDDACRQTVAAASAARLELRPLHGRQGQAWAAALPLCRLGHRSAA